MAIWATVNLWLAKTTALGGVATGIMKAQEAARATGMTGATPVLAATEEQLNSGYLLWWRSTNCSKTGVSAVVMMAVRIRAEYRFASIG